jgi:hypothetical protein
LLGKHGLLDTDGWKRFHRLVKRASKKMLRMVNQSKLQSYKTCKKYMYGFETPRGYEDAILDSTSFMARTSGRVQPSWRWINFTSMIPSMRTKASGQLLGRSSKRSEFILCMRASTGFYLVRFVGE